jgi:hypothetical protein
MSENELEMSEREDRVKVVGIGFDEQIDKW